MKNIYLIITTTPFTNYINDKNNDCLEYRMKNTHLNYQEKLSSVNIINYFINHKLDLIYTSPYNKTLELSQILSQDLKIPYILKEELSNIKIGINKISELPSYYLEQHNLDEFYKLINGESQKEIRERMIKIINTTILSSNDNILIVSHKLPIIYLLKTWCIIKNTNIIYQNKLIATTTSLKNNTIIKLTFAKNKLKNITPIYL